MSKSGRRNRRIGIRDRLGQLTYRAACRLLGDEDGDVRLRRGGRFEIELARDVYLGGDMLRVNVPDAEHSAGTPIVTIVEKTNKPSGLHLHCDACETKCDHLAAALGMVLEEKLSLGLSAPPDPAEPIENLTEEELFRRALADREQRAVSEKMTLKSLDPEQPWADYTITSRQSGKSYRVSLRGFEPGQSYCSCPDFRVNHLGVCKHILHAQTKIRKRFSQRRLRQPYKRRNLSLRLDYGAELGLRFNLPHHLDAQAKRILGPLRDRTFDEVDKAVAVIRKLERAGHSVHVYPDAEEFIEQGLLQRRLFDIAAEIRKDPGSHPLRKELLNAELLPYQMDGIAFAVGAGRAILADDMGLGKTIQGIGVAELLAQHSDIRRVLVICPASVKSQWRNEINRFCGRSSQLVIGRGAERAEQYASDAFFTICNYEQILRDHPTVERVAWDLIILDEGQRIKNWESKTSRIITALQSRFALVLTGTPLENRLEELFTVASFVDDRRLGPAYRFLHRHRIVDDRGKVKGYRNLDELRETLKPILLRRTRGSVMRDLPERTTEVVRIQPTKEQLFMSEEYVQQAAKIAAKKYLTEMDLIRLQKFLLMARMACDSTFLVNREEPAYSSKLATLAELLEQLAAEEDRKIVLFSEWTTMLGLIEDLLNKCGIDFVRLDGSVPQKKRQQLVHRFQHDDDCRAIIMSNAGSTGLNLQAANTVINVDLPWNPAVLEQRVARAHRMGQKRSVQVYLLVTEDTIEERMLATLSAKHDLALAALDVDSEVSEVELRSGMDELKRRLEQLLGEKPAAPVDVSMQTAVETEAKQVAGRRDKVAAAAGELLGAAMNLVGELVENGQAADPQVAQQIRSGLAQCADRDEAGRLQVRFTLPDDSALEKLAATLAKLLVAQA
ncbi:DEAD/DEAH box helicase [Blastopirellula retiformator]|uniref:RNA polymerase-associated protein RapA n=1 Tax=Blastopirellula retiformator TaxID=2527970 RepID=A0A5C5UYD1_9BACT|nr:DEAD/DEAH box helicase [Blastopirellula retiformator]TWT30660.1 RNA polymerase-associated protein RapA [Blastopirellula retiformator]